jgi:CheY-like chemotaxis protein
VLCVDDNKDAADLLAAVLAMLGCEARACYDGPSALAAVGAFRPDACLLDLVATTALGDLEDRTRTALAGFHYHLTKPVDPPALLAALGRFARMTGRGPAGAA